MRRYGYLEASGQQYDPHSSFSDLNYIAGE